MQSLGYGITKRPLCAICTSLADFYCSTSEDGLEWESKYLCVAHRKNIKQVAFMSWAYLHAVPLEKILESINAN